MRYTPPEGFTGTDTFSYTISDNNGGRDQAAVTVEVRELPDVVHFRLETTDSAGVPISTVSQGGEFQLRGYVEDLRANPTGVFSAYLDVTYDNVSLVSRDGEITMSDTYPNAQSGDASVLGLLDEVGGIDGLSPLGGGEVLLFSVPFQAEQAGTVIFAGNPADVLPLHAVELFGESQSVRTADISFGSAMIEIVQAGGQPDEFDVFEDSQNNILDVLANDDLGGEGAVLTLTGVSTPSQGGTATLVAERHHRLRAG